MKTKTLLLTAALLSGNTAQACTDFMVQTTDGTKLVGRSMEWGMDLKSKACQYPRNQDHTSSAPAGKAGLTWKSKFGYVALDANNMPLAVDGLNEKGLSSGLLWMPGSIYQTVAAGEESKALSVVDLNHWVLGNFSTVEEVKAAIAHVKVWAPEMADWGGIPTAHLAIHDKTGASCVIEFTDGQQKIFANPHGVLTNAPTFDWQSTNLKNYIRLSAAGAEPIKIGGTVLAPPGQGGGFLGIPGDWTPPSRFVRTSAMLGFARKATDAKSGLNLALHILNAVDIPLGDVREADNSLSHSDYTQWIVVKDMSNGRLYFRSYGNLNLRQIDLNKLDLNKAGTIVAIETGSESSN